MNDNDDETLHKDKGLNVIPRSTRDSFLLLRKRKSYFIVHD